MTHEYLERQKIQADGEDVVRIGDDYCEPDGLCVDMGPITGAWWEVPLPACPDCGGDLVWWEADYVPGTRKCVGQPLGKELNGQPLYDSDGGCGSLFSVQTTDAEIVVTDKGRQTLAHHEDATKKSNSAGPR